MLEIGLEERLFTQGGGHENWRKAGYCEFRSFEFFASFHVHCPDLPVPYNCRLSLIGEPKALENSNYRGARSILE